MTEIGFVIQPGEAIPEDVTGMRDRDDDPWAQSARGHWHTRGWHRRCDATCSNGGDPTEYAPLTVTAVREQPAEPEPPAPLVLSLPTVPDGAVAIIGAATGRQYPRSDIFWLDIDDSSYSLAQVLDAEGSVSVVMREPRTWPKLDGATPGMKARGASGNVYKFSPDSSSTGCMAHVDRIGDQFFGCWMSLGSLQEVDGPLVEVFDNKDSTR